MLQQVLGDLFFYYPWNIAKYVDSMRDPQRSTIMAIPVRQCHLVFNWDQNSFQLRVSFKIVKGSFEEVVAGTSKIIISKS
jgi:hypothetical protein